MSFFIGMEGVTCGGVVGEGEGRGGGNKWLDGWGKVWENGNTV